MRYLAIGALVAALSLAGVRSERPCVFQRENVLGTSFELKVVAASAAAARQAEAAAIREIARENAILSSWDPSSEFSRWSRTKDQAVRVSPELLEVLGMFDLWRARTGGALDAAAEVITRAWKDAAKHGRTPTEAERSAAVAAIRQEHWRLDPAAGMATHRTDAPLALNTFVKSYVMDRAIAGVLATPGVTGAVLNIGGDLVVRGAWTETVRIADPRSDEENGAAIEQIAARDTAVATSGGYRRGFDTAGKHYSHIVDPRTGDTTGHILSATVTAPKAADAGALATAFCVLSPEESARLAATVPGAEYLLVTAEGKRIVSRGWTSARPAMYAAAKPEPAPQSAGADAMEVAITIELAQLGGFARRPYVAVWVEDKDKFPVKTIALWYQKPRWLPDLRAWYHDDRMRAMAEGNEIAGSIASATRPPGKYTLKWDGKDNAGKPVKPGKYTILIEAAREHGTYQVMRQEIDWNGTPKQFTLQGNQEIAGAAIDYRKAAH